MGTEAALKRNGKPGWDFCQRVLMEEEGGWRNRARKRQWICNHFSCTSNSGFPLLKLPLLLSNLNIFLFSQLYVRQVKTLTSDPKKMQKEYHCADTEEEAQSWYWQGLCWTQGIQAATEKPRDQTQSTRLRQVNANFKYLWLRRSKTFKVSTASTSLPKWSVRAAADTSACSVRPMVPKNRWRKHPTTATSH